MSTVVNTFYEVRLEQLLSLAEIGEQIFSAASLDYRMVGGLATYFYVEEAAPDAGRLTRDLDIVVRREDLEKIAEAAEKFGFRYRHAAGVDMLVRASEPTVRRAIHPIFAGELDDAVIVECKFGGTHRGPWTGIAATGKQMEVPAALIFVFEGDALVCEKVYFDHATVLRQLGATE